MTKVHFVFQLKPTFLVAICGTIDSVLFLAIFHPESQIKNKRSVDFNDLFDDNGRYYNWNITHVKSNDTKFESKKCIIVVSEQPQNPCPKMNLDTTS